MELTFIIILMATASVIFALGPTVRLGWPALAETAMAALLVIGWCALGLWAVGCLLLIVLAGRFLAIEARRTLFDRRGFTGLEIMGIILCVTWGLSLIVKVSTPPKVKKRWKCSAAAKQLAQCGEKTEKKNRCSNVRDAETGVVLGISCEDSR